MVDFLCHRHSLLVLIDNLCVRLCLPISTSGSLTGEISSLIGLPSRIDPDCWIVLSIEAVDSKSTWAKPLV